MSTLKWQGERIDDRVREQCLRKRNKIWLGVLLLLAVWVFLPALHTRAEGVGSVEVLLPQEASGIEITLYRVADYKSEEQCFVFCGVFENCGISLGNFEDAMQAQKAAEQLAALAKEKNAEGILKAADSNGAVWYTDLALGYYLVVQTSGQEYIEVQKALVPVPYTVEDGSLAYDAVISPKYSIPDGAVILNKVDDDGAKVAEADFTLQKKVYISGEGELPSGAETGQDVDGRFFWEDIWQHLLTNSKGQVAVANLPFGIYRFIETSAPSGFILTGTPNYFSIEKAGQVKEVNGVYMAASGKVEELTVVNQQTSVKVNKVDKKGKPVAGAKLVVKSADGVVTRSADSAGAEVVSFVTTGEPYELKRLAPGNYLLSEVEAPEGYRISQDVPFTVEDGINSVNEVTMVDEKEEKTKASLTVTKKLVDQQELTLMAEDDTFYVALFEDEQRTKRVSNVQALHYVGSISEAVTFSNLEVNKSYYVGETDEFGVPIDVSTAEDGVYAPVYPGSYEIKPTKKEQHKEYTFENMFYDLPWGYTYGGNLTITKKALKGTEDYKTKATFYAAIFKDAALTERYGDVVTLAMDGSSEISVTIPVYVGESENDSTTYYVAETDKNGNVLDASAGLEYEVSVDKTEITMSPSHSEEMVTIVNAFPDESAEESESVETEKPSGGTSGGSNRSGTAAKTGDNTPFGWYAMLLALSAAGIAALLIKRKKVT